MHCEVFGYPSTMYVLDKGVVSYQKRVLLTGDTWGDDDMLLCPEDRLRTALVCMVSQLKAMCSFFFFSRCTERRRVVSTLY